MQYVCIAIDHPIQANQCSNVLSQQCASLLICTCVVVLGMLKKEIYLSAMSRHWNVQSKLLLTWPVFQYVLCGLLPDQLVLWWGIHPPTSPVLHFKSISFMIFANVVCRRVHAFIFSPIGILITCTLRLKLLAGKYYYYIYIFAV